MKLKYFLRGFGIGVLVAAIILIIARQIDNNNISDDEIIRRAQRLGMVLKEDEPLFPDKSTETSTENSTTAAIDNTSENTTEIPSEVTTEAVETTKETDKDTAEASSEEVSEETTTEAVTEPVAETTTEAVTEPVAETTTEAVTEPVTETTPAPSKEVRVYTLRITNGMFSEEVSWRLYNDGMIDSAEDFNGFLCSHKYSELIMTGTYEIRSDMSYEDIARVITHT